MKATRFAALFGAAAMAAAGQAAAHDAADEPVAAAPVDAASLAAATPALPAIATATAAAALAEPAPGAAAPAGGGEGWEVSVTPYLWMAGMEGAIGIPRGTGEVAIDQSFTDILSNLDFALMGMVDARKDRFVILGDALYLAVGTDIESSRDPRFVTGRVDIDTFIASLAAGYRVVDEDTVSVDVFAGARLLALDADLALSGPAAVRTASGSGTTVSPLVGARMRAALAPKLTFGLYGDVGSIISGADAKWQVMGDLRYQIGKSWTMLAGYRFMSIDHETNGFEFDVDMSGPMLGVSYRF